MINRFPSEISGTLWYAFRDLKMVEQQFLFATEKSTNYLAKEIASKLEHDTMFIDLCYHKEDLRKSTANFKFFNFSMVLEHTSQLILHLILQSRDEN